MYAGTTEELFSADGLVRARLLALLVAGLTKADLFSVSADLCEPKSLLWLC